LAPTGSINLGFLLRENLLLYASHLPLGVPNGHVLYAYQRARETLSAASSKKAEKEKQLLKEIDTKKTRRLASSDSSTNMGKILTSDLLSLRNSS
jgi:hypothetical protein